MSALRLEADPYHTLRKSDRDHLLAAAMLISERDELPSGRTVCEAVGRLTANTPTNKTTGVALERLEGEGLVERVDGKPDHRSRGVRVTEQGQRVLGRGAARLAAAATAQTDSEEESSHE